LPGLPGSGLNTKQNNRLRQTAEPVLLAQKSQISVYRSVLHRTTKYVIPRAQSARGNLLVRFKSILRTKIHRKSSNCSMDRYYFEQLTSFQEIATSAPSGPPRNDTVIWWLAASIQQNDKLQFITGKNVENCGMLW
jgi:hypothetical protein